MPGSAKLTYLRSYLQGYAYKIISHLSITDENYETALSLLKAEFLDLEFITDEYFRQIVNTQPKYDQDWENVRQYLNETRAALHELKSYNIDLLDENTAGNKFVSHLIFHKLPNTIRREFVHKVNTNFPSINQIFENYNDIIKTLSRTSYKKDFDKTKDHNSGSARQPKSNSYKGQSDREHQTPTGGKSKPHSTLENFQTKTEKGGFYKSMCCKFCNTDTHSMFNCPKYTSHTARADRCKELNLCVSCSGSNHESKKCFGLENRLTFECRICNSKSHISALCTK